MSKHESFSPDPTEPPYYPEEQIPYIGWPNTLAAGETLQLGVSYTRESQYLKIIEFHSRT